MKLSSVAVGVMRWGVWGANHSPKKVQELIETALANDLTTFDHADIYGGYTTEKLFGGAYKGMKINREEIQLISKCGIEYPGGEKDFQVKTYNYAKDYIVKCVDESLQNLATDYLDLLLLHRPSPLMNPAEISFAFKELLQQGKVRNFGVSNFTPSQFDLIDEHFPLMTNQIEISINQTSALTDGTLDHLMLSKLRPMAWSPLGNYFSEETEQNNRLKVVVEKLANKYDKSEDQILLAWLLKHPSGIIPVIGTSRKEGIISAANSLKINLERVDWFEILIASQGHKVA